MTKSLFLQRLIATIQFILGFVLGIALLAGISASVGFYYLRQLSSAPKKPVYSEEQAPSKSTDSTEAVPAPEKVAPSTAAAPPETPVKSPKITETKPKPKPEPEIEPEIESESLKDIEPELPPNAYRAEVTWPQGLSLRAEPSINAGRVGGVGYNSELIILEDTADGMWQKVRIPWSGQEGWVKAGNTQRLSY